jgi:hypothetical protein
VSAVRSSKSASLNYLDATQTLQFSSREILQVVLSIVHEPFTTLSIISLVASFVCLILKGHLFLFIVLWYVFLFIHFLASSDTYLRVFTLIESSDKLFSHLCL